MFDTTSSSPLHNDLLASIAATLSDLSVRVERLDSRIDTVVSAPPLTQPQPLPSPSEPTPEPTDEWVWEGNHGWPRALGRPAGW